MVHPDTELRHINKEIGYGVVATRFIPRGTITWVSDSLDRAFPPGFEQTLNPVLRHLFDKYAYMNGDGESILCWDHARFINHSCEATSLSPGFDFEIAVRDVQAGEQLTDDYGTLNLNEDFPCGCLSPRCRRVLRPDDIERHGKDWDALIASAFPLIVRVQQPLWPLVKERDQVEDVLNGTSPIPSCFRHYRKQNMADLNR
jgi:hypothetical protein